MPLVQGRRTCLNWALVLCLNTPCLMASSEHKDQRDATTERRYYISRRDLGATQVNQQVRQHWSPHGPAARPFSAARR
jgi:hypothetical protein